MHIETLEKYPKTQLTSDNDLFEIKVDVCLIIIVLNPFEERINIFSLCHRFVKCWLCVKITQTEIHNKMTETGK